MTQQIDSVTSIDLSIFSGNRLEYSENEISDALKAVANIFTADLLLTEVYMVKGESLEYLLENDRFKALDPAIRTQDDFYDHIKMSERTVRRCVNMHRFLRLKFDKPIDYFKEIPVSKLEAITLLSQRGKIDAIEDLEDLIAQTKLLTGTDFGIYIQETYYSQSPTPLPLPTTPSLPESTYPSGLTNPDDGLDGRIPEAAESTSEEDDDSLLPEVGSIYRPEEVTGKYADRIKDSQAKESAISGDLVLALGLSKNKTYKLVEMTEAEERIAFVDGKAEEIPELLKLRAYDYHGKPIFRFL